MQILLPNGGITPAFECSFRNTKSQDFFPDSETTEFDISPDDVPANFRSCAIIAYITKYPNYSGTPLSLFLQHQNNKTFLVVSNKDADTSIKLSLILTEKERDNLNRRFVGQI